MHEMLKPMSANDVGQRMRAVLHQKRDHAFSDFRCFWRHPTQNLLDPSKMVITDTAKF